MFEFFPMQLRSAEIDMTKLNARVPDLADQLADDDAEYDSDSEDAPFVQLDYEEIGDESLKGILSYAEMNLANSPLGVPYACSPLAAQSIRGHEILIYPLSGFADHLRKTRPDAIKLQEGFNSFEELLEASDEGEVDINVEQNLVLALLEAIKFCQERKLGLVTHW